MNRQTQASLNSRTRHIGNLNIFLILRKINKVAYHMELSPQAQVHPVFHLSQLRPFMQPGTPISPTLPTTTNIPAVPMEVLQTRWRKKHGAMIEQVRIRWLDVEAMSETWEDKVELQSHFPDAEAWGQAMTQGGWMSAALTCQTHRLVHVVGPELVRAELPKKMSTTKAPSGCMPLGQLRQLLKVTRPKVNHLVDHDNRRRWRLLVLPTAIPQFM